MNNAPNNHQGLTHTKIRPSDAAVLFTGVTDTGEYGYGLDIIPDKTLAMGAVILHVLSRGQGDGDGKNIKKGLGGFANLAEAEAKIAGYAAEIEANGIDHMPEYNGRDQERISRRSKEPKLLIFGSTHFDHRGYTLHQICEINRFFNKHDAMVKVKDIMVDKQIRSKRAGLLALVMREYEGSAPCLTSDPIVQRPARAFSSTRTSRRPHHRRHPAAAPGAEARHGATSRQRRAEPQPGHERCGRPDRGQRRGEGPARPDDARGAAGLRRHGRLRPAPRRGASWGRSPRPPERAGAPSLLRRGKGDTGRPPHQGPARAGGSATCATSPGSSRRSWGTWAPSRQGRL